ncbi:DUF692 domain-containing protein [Rhodococcoides kyotonense]|uniref:Endonuclease n=1 Tax=Rhodococcoides kyotonense TaxID=398843 RepID=A0A239D3E2_9NOCA|nr:DUF692 domain-containing protein [Rhodococcus kyotonensis]SNS26870.1 hypothetical protein SAMN05421642_101360 [Rhodococcus kyotonensis]
MNGLHGIGIGWRPEIAGVIADLHGLAFCEVIAESIGSSVPDPLSALGVPVVPHGVSLSLGSDERVDSARVQHLSTTATLLDAPLVSEHIAFVRSGGIEAGHLLPMPRTFEAVDALARNISITQAELPVPLAVENIASLFDWPEDELTEGEFLAELIDRTGVTLVLDIANVYANALNRRTDPLTELRRLPLGHIAYCHVAGGSVRDGMYHDTHTDPVPDHILALLEYLADSGLCPPVMLERDGNFPPAAEILAELDAIAHAMTLPSIVSNTWRSRS